MTILAASGITHLLMKPWSLGASELCRAGKYSAPRLFVAPLLASKLKCTYRTYLAYCVYRSTWGYGSNVGTINWALSPEVSAQGDRRDDSKIRHLFVACRCLYQATEPHGPRGLCTMTMIRLYSAATITLLRYRIITACVGGVAVMLGLIGCFIAPGRSADMNH